MTAFTLHSLAVANKLPVPAGMRLCRVIRKESAQKKAGKEVKESQGCFVPLVSEAKIQALLAVRPDVLAHWVAQLENDVVRAVADSGRSPSEADLSVEKLCEVFDASGVSERFTTKQLEEVWKRDWRMALVNSIAASRGWDLTDPDIAAMATKVADNHWQFVAMYCGRNPTWQSEAVKEKALFNLLELVKFLEDCEADVGLLVRVVDRLAGLSVASVSEIAL